MKLRFWISLILFTAFVNAGIAQLPGLTLPDFTIHSPSVRGLGQYGEYPIDISTGVPDITVPLYTIKTKRLTLPVQLSYHASGIKVDQEASYVGLGWTLQAGGSVTRLIRDKLDEITGFLDNGANLPMYNSVYDMEGAGAIGNTQALKDLYAYMDKEPDLFSVNVSTLSDQFCLNNSGNFVSLGKFPFKYEVSFTNNLIIARDNSGTIYRFGKTFNNMEAFESTYATNVTGGDGNAYSYTPYPTYNSTWHLTAIISADLSDTIQFTYKTGVYTDERIVNTTRYIYNDYPTNPGQESTGKSQDGTIITSANTFIHNLRIPDKIIFNGGYLQFTTSNDRLDLKQSGDSGFDRTRITGFIVYNDNNVAVNKVIFKNEGYFERTGSGRLILSLIDGPHYRKSLKLDAVEFADRNNIVINDYKFYYENTALPSRNTTAQDHWGYYNGKDNATLIPQTLYRTMPSGAPTIIGDDRKANINYMKAASLNKIVYPTGGYTTYEFEANAYLTSQQSSNLREESTQKTVTACNLLSNCETEHVSGPANNIVEFTITDDIGNSGYNNLRIFFSDFKNPGGSSGMEGMTFKITNLSNNTSYFCEHKVADRNQHKEYTTPFNITKGITYRVELFTNGVTGSNLSLCNSPYIIMRWEYTKIVQVTEEQIVPTSAGGLRVKTISNYNTDNSLITKKSYAYGDTRYNPGVGKIITDPNKNFYVYPLLYEGTSIARLYRVLWLTSNSQVELGLHNGCPVDYEKVVETIISNNSSNTNGKTEYYYSPTRGDYEPRSTQKYPYAVVNYPAWKSKNLKEIIQYKKDNAIYVPVSSTSFEYADLGEERIRTAAIMEIEPDKFYGSGGAGNGWTYIYDNPERFFYYTYYISRGKVVKSVETVKNYIDGQVSMITAKTYQYNSNFDIIKERSSNSKDEVLERNMKYSGDLNYPVLADRNIISLPVMEEKLIAGKINAGSIIQYNDHGHPISHFSFNSENPQTPINYTDAFTPPTYYKKNKNFTYDPNTKNISEVKEESAGTTIYLWSYKNQLPIAEIKNISFSEVVAVLGASAINNFGNKNPTPLEIQTFLAPLRTDARLKNTTVRSYIHEPLIGIKNTIDANGFTTSYEYDNVGRLKIIRDNNGAILKQYDYRYLLSIQ